MGRIHGGGRIQGWVIGVAQSADLVLAASGDAYLRAWSKKDGALVLEMKTPNNKVPRTVAVQGNLAAVGTQQGGLFLIDLATASVLRLQGHTNTVCSVIFDGNEIISGSFDRTLRVWDKISGRETLSIDRENWIFGVAAHENLLVAGLGHAVCVFDRASGHGPRHVLTETGTVWAVAIDAQHMVSGSNDNKVRVYAVPSFELVHVLEGHTNLVRSVALEGDRIVSGSDDKTVRLWDARSGDALHVLQGHSYSVSLLGSEIVSGSDDKTVRLWDAETGASTRKLKGTEVVRSIEKVLGAAAKEALKTALANGDAAELGRCKLMLIGQGAAGKTSTVRSLLGMEPEPAHISTVGVKLTRTDAESWEEIKDADSGFERQAYRVAALRMAVEGPVRGRGMANKVGTLTRFTRALASTIGRTRKSGTASSTTEERVELVPEAEVAQRFDVAEVENMAGKTRLGQKIYFTIWDYAGQEVFYALHHIFLTSEGGVYMLVFDMQELLGEREKALKNLTFWLNSVKLHAPEAPVLLVGTHFDQAGDKLEAVENILLEDLTALHNVKLVKNHSSKLSFFPVDNMSTAEDRAADLRQAVEETASELESVSQKISLRWLKVIEDLMLLDCDYVSFATVQELATQYHAGDQTDELLKFFHDLGMVVHLRATAILHEKVVMKPQWLLDKLARVIADDMHVQDIYYDKELSKLELVDDFNVLRNKSIGTRILLKYLWANEEVEYLRAFMDETMLLSNWAFPEKALARAHQNEPLFLVSSLLKNSTNDSLSAEIAGMDAGLTCVLDFSEFFLPDGFFARLLSLCAKHSGDTVSRKYPPRLAGNKAILRFGLSVFALEQIGDEIWIRVKRDSDKPASTLKMLLSMFQGAREALYPNLPWELLLQSPTDASVLVAHDDLEVARASEVKSFESMDATRVKVADFAQFFEDGSLLEDIHGTTGIDEFADMPLDSRLQYHVFLSHKQYEAGDACDLMAEKLKSRGLEVWVDQRTEGNLSTTEMKDAILASKCYLLFLTKTVFSSKAVCMELATALEAEKPILLVHESDPNRVGFANFSTYIDTVPKAAKHIFDARESMPFQRRLYLAEAFYDELIRRIDSS
ncbi:F-box/WD repeat-containing protein 7 [Hondaea fermentalgiana]|uniref:non-specific serine/threonine protein kinase n=1 Tax=Hondaea fermentalgiana TaxID=2315210 RepID=A0A2R5GWZ1_9STRA|nr:F-box/WD repeat-containing protein 7 [Hondaea fermentalgiana]|eukprot:GBG34849.1 F-box/WD repeat-containing protein 7 [Hondaea fermentalgiana]